VSQLSDSTAALEPSAEPSLQTLVRQLAEAQAQLDFLRRQLTETQRLATIGTIAAVIAHEFNNLLTPIVSYSQYALGSAESDHPDMELIKKALTRAFMSAEKAGKICASLLGLARGQPALGSVSVQELIDQTVTAMARDPQKDGIALRVQAEAGLSIQGDAIQLEQVLLNLLINARQAMLGRGGALTIKAAREGESKTARIQVSDTGCGIPEKLLDKIFQPFFTTKGTVRSGEVRGSGLGLAICKQIIERHGGRIDVASQAGRGTTFTLLLPLAAA
jgi:signal transduction histidine kinase